VGSAVFAEMLWQFAYELSPIFLSRFLSSCAHLSLPSLVFGLSSNQEQRSFFFQSPTYAHPLFNKLSTMLSTVLVALVASAAAVSAAPAFARNGDGTWYDVSVGYTACGTLHGNGEYVIAVDHAFYDSKNVDGNPNHSKVCGKQVKIDGPSANGPVIATIVDRCAGCATNDIDMTPSLFQAVVGSTSIGRARVTWQFL
jgi:hypothetical protein